MSSVCRCLLPVCVIIFLNGCNQSSTPVQQAQPIAQSNESCSVQGLPQPGAGPLAIPPNATNGGTFTGAAGTINNPINLVPGAGSLTIITRNNLDVQADIKFPGANRPPGTPSMSINLVSLQGTVTIHPGVTVGANANNGSASGGTAAGGGTGTTAGKVFIYGHVIDVKGEVRGMQGGAGAPVRLDQRANPSANGNNGGVGGQVVLCGLDAIAVVGAPSPGAAIVIGGKGGVGGTVLASGSQSATSTGASGGVGGDAHFIGIDPNGMAVQVSVGGMASGGEGGLGSAVNAAAREANNGGAANATGGPGGIGGTVKFRQAEVIQRGTIQAGDGGQGGRATAEAGDGAPNLLGGHGIANGGPGNAPGARPGIPLPNNGVANGVAGTPGSGGNSSAKSGAGGAPGGSSGTASARGGANGAGARSAAAATGGPNVAAAGRPGGSARATQPGTP